MFATISCGLMLGAVTLDSPVLVLDFESVDVEPATTQDIQHFLVEALRSREIDAATTDEVARFGLDEKDAELASCEQDSSCISEVAQAGKVRYVISGSVGKVGAQLILGISLIDTQTSEAIGRGGTTAPDQAGIVAQLDAVIRQLLEGDEYVRPTIDLPENPRFVVLDFRGSGLPDGMARNLTQVVATEVRRIEGAAVLSRSDVEAMLGAEELRQVLDGNCDRSCFVRISGALDADYLVLGQVGQLEKTFVVNLTAIDQRAVAEGGAHRITETYQGSADELIRATRFATQEMFGLTEGTGGLSVGASTSGARLYVNNEEVGDLPMPPLTELSPGRYAVRLEKGGYFDWRSDVYVTPNDTSVIWADPEKQPAQWYQKWWVWTIVGGVVVGGAAAIAAAATAEDPSTGTVDVVVE